MINKITGFRVLIMPISLLAVVLISILFIQPEYSDMRSLQKSVADDTAQLSDIQTQQNKLSSLQSSLGALEGKNLVDAALPEKGNPEDYLIELYQRSAKSGIILSDVSFAGKAASGAPYACGAAGSAVPSASSTPVANSGNAAAGILPASPVCADSLGADISVTGSWDQILNFLKYATDSNRLATITGIDLAAGSSGTAGTQQVAAGDILSAKISLEIYSKTKNEASSQATIASLVSGQGFDKNALQSLVNLVYTPYEAPTVSQTGERNIFK